MAMAKCRECGAEVSDQAKTCPKCGVANPVKKMSIGGKLFLGLVGLAAIGSMINGANTGSSTGSAPPPRVSSAAPTSAARSSSTPMAVATPAPAAPTPAPDPAAERAKHKSELDQIRQHLAENREHLKKYYGNTEQLRTASDDQTRAEGIAAKLAGSKDPKDQKQAAEAKSLAVQVAVQGRAIYASSIEEVFMKSGMNAKARASGKANERLTITYALMSQPLVYKFQNEIDVPSQARKFGFTKIVYTNGFESSLGESWTVNL
ncbi:zinc ribbon domain-containing protein [Ramlibacter sp. MMS24-I3-19]|uniref:zinc ribbon domain-containing protein n=1 Tax=Ramlibacter sp. MMS24-I3-19 TaxID=3416606 RepID=UPI003CFEED31